MLPPQNKGQIFSDVVNIPHIVKFGKQYLSCKINRARCMGKQFMWEAVQKEKQEKYR
jgi:hypothetical protein